MKFAGNSPKVDSPVINCEHGPKFPFRLRIRLALALLSSWYLAVWRLGMRMFRVWRCKGGRAFLHRALNKLRHRTGIKNNAPQAVRVAEKPSEKQLNQNKYVEVYAGLLAAAANHPDDNYVPLAEAGMSTDQAPVKLIAFYLPQFHPIPENDQWWGRGFTEWTNVSKAIPQFAGHYQPHFPGELGFYDLRVPEVQRRQVALAKQYGIYGFCFHYYWFHGMRLLERPLEQFITDPEIDFPFCLCWANENWTRRWDGLDNEILVAQTHSEAGDFAFIRDIEPILRHRRYIRIHGRPLLIVYQTRLMPDPAATAGRWREYCRRAGIGDLYLVAAQTFGFTDPGTVGFDAAVEFPPHNVVLPQLNHAVKLLNHDFMGQVHQYAEIVAQLSKQSPPAYQLFKTVFPGWDNEPRRPGRGHVFLYSSPDIYQYWLTKACQFAMGYRDPELRLVFVNAWNEWAEGAHLEPDRKYGYAYLQATSDALQAVYAGAHRDKGAGEFLMSRPSEQYVKKHDTAVIVHIYYAELWSQMRVRLKVLDTAFDLYISIVKGISLSEADIRKDFPGAYVLQCPNRGRDIAPFLQILPLVCDLQYQYALKMHAKKTVCRADGEDWREDMLKKLLGSSKNVAAAKEALEKEDVGLVAPAGHLLPAEFYWGLDKDMEMNIRNVKGLAKKAGLPVGDLKFPFAAGSMYWFKPGALRHIAFLSINPDEFGPEQGQKDGTLAHAFERFLGLWVVRNGYQIAEIDGEGRVRLPSDERINYRTDYPFAAATQEGKPLDAAQLPPPPVLPAEKQLSQP